MGLVGLVVRSAWADTFKVVRPAKDFAASEKIAFPARAGLGGLAYLPDGRLATYDTSTGEILAHGGSQSSSLAKFSPSVFGSFLVLAPGGDALIFGESSTGGVYSVPLAGGGATPIDHISFNFDLAFDASGHGLVSAPGLGGANSIRLLDGDPLQESREVVVNLGGFSGPVALDVEGNLYYGTYNPALLGGQQILKFRSDLLQRALEGPPLVEADAELYLDELPGAYNLRVSADRVLFTDLGFSSGTGTLFGAKVGSVVSVFPIATFQVPAGLCSPSVLAFRPGSLPFLAGSGMDGGSVAVAYSDFATVSGVAEITPRPYFVRGSLNGDSVVDLSDAVYLLSFLFLGGEAPAVADSADVNADGALDLFDPIYLLDYLFQGGPQVPAPFPNPGL